MSRPGGVMKQDAHATEHWRWDAYAAIPKSVFATVAWHLANALSESCDAPGMAEKRFAEEIDALVASGILPAAQGKRAIAAVSKAGGGT